MRTAGRSRAGLAISSATSETAGQSLNAAATTRSGSAPSTASPQTINAQTTTSRFPSPIVTFTPGVTNRSAPAIRVRETPTRPSASLTNPAAYAQKATSKTRYVPFWKPAGEARPARETAAANGGG